jgi:hypothetical protein
VCRERFPGGEPILNILLNNIYSNNNENSKKLPHYFEIKSDQIDSDSVKKKSRPIVESDKNSELELIPTTVFSTLSISSIGNYIYIFKYIYIYIYVYIHAYIFPNILR